MGYTNAEENYKRLQKFNDNHVSQVVQDYIDNPIKEAGHVGKPATNSIPVSDKETLD
jgi:hypothetical protein